MSTVRYFLLAVEIIGLCVFLLPIFVDTINAGNTIGILFFTALLFVTALFDRVSSFVGLAWRHALGKAVLIAAAVLIAVFITLAVLLSALMIKAQLNKPIGKTTVIVLGCKVKGDRPSRMLRYRLDEAYDYLKDNKNAVCIVSGGKGKDESISEAQCMFNYLTSKDISADRVIMEDKSTNTYQNITFSKEIIKQRNLPENITIVTDGFHQYRASFIAKRCKVKKSYSLSAKTELFFLPTYWVREWAAILYEWVK